MRKYLLGICEEWKISDPLNFEWYMRGFKAAIVPKKVRIALSILRVMDWRKSK